MKLFHRSPVHHWCGEFLQFPILVRSCGSSQRIDSTEKCPIPSLRYDLPATIDLIVRETGVDKIHYVSHSMGGTQFLVAMSERPGMYMVTQHVGSNFPLTS